MGKMAYQVILPLLAIVVLTSADRNMTEGDISVNIKGQSGKISFKKGNNSVTVNFDYIHELNDASESVGTTGRSKHSINTFATQSFTFKTSGLEVEYQNISVKHTQFEANIAGTGAKLVVDIYIFKANGSVSTSNNETLEVEKGTIKFNIMIENWTFCGDAGESCKKGKTNEVGTQLEFGIEIKGRGRPTKKSKAKGKGRKVSTLDLGGADCTLSGAVDVDGNWMEMVGSYPKVETKGSKTLFIFRFPKFNSSVKYDPTIEMSGSDDGGSGGGGGGGSGGGGGGGGDGSNAAARFQVGFLAVILSMIAFVKIAL